MQLKTKKIIAREGVIIICIIAVGVATLLLVAYHGGIVDEQINDLKEKYNIVTQYDYEKGKWSGSIKGRIPFFKYSDEQREMLNKVLVLEEKGQIMLGILPGIFLIFFFGYPFYLFLRFIFWAVNVLRRKEE